MELGSPQKCPVPGQDTVGINWHTESSFWTPVSFSLQLESSSNWSRLSAHAQKIKKFCSSLASVYQPEQSLNLIWMLGEIEEPRKKHLQTSLFQATLGKSCNSVATQAAVKFSFPLLGSSAAGSLHKKRALHVKPVLNIYMAEQTAQQADECQSLNYSMPLYYFSNIKPIAGVSLSHSRKLPRLAYLQKVMSLVPSELR